MSDGLGPHPARRRMSCASRHQPGQESEQEEQGAGTGTVPQRLEATLLPAK